MFTCRLAEAALKEKTLGTLRAEAHGDHGVLDLQAEEVPAQRNLFRQVDLFLASSPDETFPVMAQIFAGLEVVQVGEFVPQGEHRPSPSRDFAVARV
jgi:hypothetical protein